MVAIPTIEVYRNGILTRINEVDFNFKTDSLKKTKSIHQVIKNIKEELKVPPTPEPNFAELNDAENEEDIKKPVLKR